MLGGRPEERFKFACGVLVGAVIAIPFNTLNLTNWQYPIELAYVLLGVCVLGLVFRKYSVALGLTGTVLLVSLPQALAALLPSPLTRWYIAAGSLWLLAFGIFGCLYIIRGAETRTDADIDAGWLFRERK